MTEPDALVAGSSPDAPQPASPSVENATKGADIKTIGDLIAFAYAQGGKRFSVPVNVLESIASRRERADVDDDVDPALDQILELSAADPLLAVPPRLLIAVEDGGAAAPLRRRIADLISGVLRRHPVFRTGELHAALISPPPKVADVFETLKSTVKHLSVEQLGSDSKDIKPTDRDKLLTNSITTLALVLAIRDRWTIGELVLQLDTHLWQTALTKPGARPGRVLVADTRTPDALGVVAQVFRARVRRAETRVEELDSYSQQASRRAFEAEAVVEERDRELDARAAEIHRLTERIDHLNEALKSERQKRVVDQSHHFDDYENLRTRVVRMLSRHTDLLSDGLHALRNDSTAVTDEYLERVIDALTKELEQLRAEEGGT